jgi:hypothetical protein
MRVQLKSVLLGVVATLSIGGCSIANAASVDFSARLVSDQVQIAGGALRQATVLGGKARIGTEWDTAAGRFSVHATPYIALALDRNSQAGNRVRLGDDGRIAEAPAWAYIGEAAVEWMPAPDASIRAGIQPIATPFLEPDNTRIFAPNFWGTRFKYATSGCRAVTLGRVSATIPRGRTSLQRLETANSGIELPRLDFVGLEAGCPNETRAALHFGRAAGAWDQYLAVLDLPVDGVGFAKANLIRTRNYSPTLSARNGVAASAYFAIGTRDRYLRFGAQWIGRGSDYDWIAETDGNVLVNAYAGDYNLAGERAFQVRLHMAPGALEDRWIGASLWYTHGARTIDTQRASNHEHGLRLFSRPLAKVGMGKLSASIVHVRYRRSVAYPGLSYNRTQLSVNIS